MLFNFLNQIQFFLILLDGDFDDDNDNDNGYNDDDDGCGWWSKSEKILPGHAWNGDFPLLLCSSSTWTLALDHHYHEEEEEEEEGVLILHLLDLATVPPTLDQEDLIQP